MELIKKNNYNHRILMDYRIKKMDKIIVVITINKLNWNKKRICGQNGCRR